MKNTFLNLKKSLYDFGSAVLITILTGEHSGESCVFSKNMNVSGAVWHDVLHRINYDNLPSIQNLGGNTEVLVERICNRPKLVICGAGHISVPLAKVANMLDFDITVIDDRPQFVNCDRFSEASSLICKPFKEAFSEIVFDENTYFVVITRAHSGDKECLETILSEKFGYVGMIGSEKKIKTVMDELRQIGIDEQLLSKVHSPIGLSIGAQTPSEITISIVAEIIEVKSSKIVGNPIDSEVIDVLCKLNEPALVATIIKKSGSAPRGGGTRMVVLKNGTIFGTIGGGRAEYEIISAASDVIDDGYPQIVNCNIKSIDKSGSDVDFGGSLKLFLQPTT